MIVGCKEVFTFPVHKYDRDHALKDDRYLNKSRHIRVFQNIVSVHDKEDHEESNVVDEHDLKKRSASFGKYRKKISRYGDRNAYKRNIFGGTVSMRIVDQKVDKSVLTNDKHTKQERGQTAEKESELPVMIYVHIRRDDYKYKSEHRQEYAGEDAYRIL